MDCPVKISVCNHNTDKKYKNQERPWSYLKERNRTPVRTSETAQEYPKLPKAQHDSAKDHGGLVGGWLRGGIRKNGDVLCRTIGMLDADKIPQDIDFPAQVNQALPDVEYFIYSTHSHTPAAPRYRVAIRLGHEVSEDEYPALMRMVAKQIGIDYFDDTTYQSNRMMYWSSCPSNGEFVFVENDGEPLDPDKYLAMYEDWRDVTQWPNSSRESEAHKREVRQQQDPLTKEGVVGAFCRAYEIEDAIAVFLPDIYEPSAIAGRFDFIPADSSAGVVLYDGKWAYSHHATDPASGKLLNAFDLVRFHKFPDLDEKASFKSMSEFAVGDERVNALLLEERRELARQDFAECDEWTKALQREKGGLLMNNLHNITLILQNDENLKPIVFNQLLDGMEIKGDVPWKHPSRFWRDADDAQLISYVDSHYGTFSARNYDIAVAKVTDDRSYHPIRAFLNALPEWDGIARVDTLLVDYLAADDNEYVRAVTRKTLCAAIARVLAPGCKFDSMLVLSGPQGVGKSTLIKKLAGDWFSDSLSLGDTKDKTAAEKLQGYWILEIGELAGLKKADVETLRSFLSRQNDIYRASFGKRATPHFRQCVFFGTTNAEKGYLRDTTGNRRFWPVKTPGNGNKYSWGIADDEVLQIWAEVLVYVKKGEELYLDTKLEKLAKEEQREAMESDEREGLVRDYLDTLLPDGWDAIDLYDRRSFLNGREFGGDRRVGKNHRISVSNMEIWCECFGKERSNLKRLDSGEISSILTRIGGWTRAEKKERIPIYGSQWVYVPTRCSQS